MANHIAMKLSNQLYRNTTLTHVLLKKGSQIKMAHSI